MLGAHTVPEQSAQLAGLNVEITGVANDAAGQAPMVSFKLTEGDGTVLRDLSGFNRVAFAMSGPTSDYPRAPRRPPRSAAAPREPSPGPTPRASSPTRRRHHSRPTPAAAGRSAWRRGAASCWRPE